MTATLKSERPHISLFGRRNSGKSTLINTITGQMVATVSETAGTTTDPVYKAMELQPVGPVVFVDTAGLDDEGILGQLRIEKTKGIMRKTDLALLVLDSGYGFAKVEEEILVQLKILNIPIIIVLNKIDQKNSHKVSCLSEGLTQIDKVIEVSGKNGVGVEELKAQIVKHLMVDLNERPLVKDLLQAGDKLVLVTPIDAAAPKGRLILPQVQVLRESLDVGAIALVTQVKQLEETLRCLKGKPSLVITDSQVFKEVAEMIDEDLPLTSFSILMARYKGEINAYIEGIDRIRSLQPGDKVLIAEACTHQRQHEDIGTIKIPKLLQKKIAGELNFSWVRGGEFPTELRDYKVVIHCGGCMLTQREVLNRIKIAKSQGVPTVNYGMLLAYLNSILERSLLPLKGEDSVEPIK